MFSNRDMACQTKNGIKNRERLPPIKASTQLKKCLQEVRFMFNHGDFLNYTVLKNCFKRLARNEINQLVDFIITTYNVVDYKETTSLYGSYGKMLIAFDSNTGSDHDMKEEYSDNSYKGYISSIKALSNVYEFGDPKDILKLSDEERRFLARKLAHQLNVSRFIAETLLRIYQPKKRFRN